MSTLQPAGQAFRINTTASSYESGTEAIALPDGRAFVTWRNDAGIHARIVDPDGTSQPDFRVGAAASDRQNPAAALLGDGRVMVFWESNSGGSNGVSGSIQGSIVATDGSAPGAEFTVCTTWEAGMVPGQVAATSLADGRVLVTWSTYSGGSEGELRGRFYGIDGSAQGEDFLLGLTDFGDNLPAVAALSDGRVLVTWVSWEDPTTSGAPDRSFDTLLGRTIDASGTMMSEVFRVNSSTGRDEQEPHVVALPEGRALVLWAASTGFGAWEVRGRILGADGSFEGDDFIVNDAANPALDTWEIHATAMPDGRVFIVWTGETDDDGNGYADFGTVLRGRVMEADGSFLAPEMRLTWAQQGTGSPYLENATATALADGRILVTWQDDRLLDSNNQFGTLQGVYVYNTVTGTAQADKAEGTPFLDVMWGREGNDTLAGLAGDDSLRGETGDDSLVGGTGNDFLEGGAGNDTLVGGAGGDRMSGGLGNDTYIVDDSSDIVEGEFSTSGVDTVLASVAYTLPAFVENLTLTGSALRGTGNAEANRITGQAGANTLEGGTGNDTLMGMAGNDTLVGGAGKDSLDGGSGGDRMDGGAGGDVYVVDSTSDRAVDTGTDAEKDLVLSSVSFTLDASLENLTLAGTAARGTGNAKPNVITGNGANNLLEGLVGADTLSGGAGNDTLDGGLGADSMVGGAGSDTYIVNIVDDVVVESASGGTDTVRSFISYTLGDNLEHLVLAGGTARNGIGNVLNNSITGSPDANLLSGRSGNDTLSGGNGADTLNGGAGADRLTGGAGGDRFVYTLVADSRAGTATRDTITDFSRAQGDRIDLSAIDAITGGANNAFVFVTGVFTGAGQVRFVDGVLQANVDGDLRPDLEIVLTGVTSLAAGDIVL